MKNGLHIDKFGTKKYYLNNELHNEDGPAVECSDGHKQWRIHGKCHREDGPAVEYSTGMEEWWNNGKLHRENGPAIKYSSGDKSYYLNHIKYSEEQYWKIVKSLNFILEKSKKQLCNK
jgi:hypothetical protein